MTAENRFHQCFVFVSSAPPGCLRVSSVRGPLALLTPTGDSVALRCSSRPGRPLPSSTLGTLPERPPQTQNIGETCFLLSINPLSIFVFTSRVSLFKYIFFYNFNFHFFKIGFPAFAESYKSILAII